MAAEQTIPHLELESRDLWPLELAQQTLRSYLCSLLALFFFYAYRQFDSSRHRGRLNVDYEDLSVVLAETLVSEGWELGQ
jgi:hypothetical protein